MKYPIVPQCPKCGKALLTQEENAYGMCEDCAVGDTPGCYRDEIVRIKTYRKGTVKDET